MLKNTQARHHDAWELRIVTHTLHGTKTHTGIYKIQKKIGAFKVNLE